VDPHLIDFAKRKASTKEVLNFYKNLSPEKMKELTNDPTFQDTLKKYGSQTDKDYDKLLKDTNYNLPHIDQEKLAGSFPWYGNRGGEEEEGEGGDWGRNIEDLLAKWKRQDPLQGDFRDVSNYNNHSEPQLLPPNKKR